MATTILRMNGTQESTAITGIINEEWRSISGNINYQVSNIGRVRNVKTGRIMKGFTSDGYVRVGMYHMNTRKMCSVHRLVAREFLTNTENKAEVDHIDHNRSNNCLTNLRWTTAAENQRNSVAKRNTTSKYKGVTFNRQHKKWRAQIQPTGNAKHIGYYNSEKEAAIAYNTCAREMYGEYANLNDVSDDDTDI